MGGDKQLALQNEHISTAKIKQDIADTEREIINYTRKAKGYDLIGDKMSKFRANAYRSGIKERKEFVEKLKSILEYRESLDDELDKESEV
jgi:hypothetical protein